MQCCEKVLFVRPGSPSKLMQRVIKRTFDITVKYQLFSDVLLPPTAKYFHDGKMPQLKHLICFVLQCRLIRFVLFFYLHSAPIEEHHRSVSLHQLVCLRNRVCTECWFIESSVHLHWCNWLQLYANRRADSPNQSIALRRVHLLSAASPANDSIEELHWNSWLLKHQQEFIADV